jgi:4'-phosphopantetheinyl transferase EntD
VPGPTPEEAVAAALAALAPPGVRTGVRRITDADLEGLRGVERQAVAAARPRRRREFASGRALLRSLLGVDAAIGVRADRSPALPAGWCGTLAHDDDLVVAAVADERTVRALGVDVEARRPLDDTEAGFILRDDEAGLDPILAFVLKEAAYKAWSALGGGLLGHHDVALRCAGDRFEAAVVADGAEAAVLGGRFRACGDRWLALAAAAR